MLLGQGEGLEGGVVDVIVAERLPHTGQSPITGRLPFRPVEHVALQILQTRLGCPRPRRRLHLRVQLRLAAPLVRHLRLVHSLHLEALIKLELHLKKLKKQILPSI